MFSTLKMLQVKDPRVVIYYCIQYKHLISTQILRKQRQSLKEFKVIMTLGTKNTPPHSNGLQITNKKQHNGDFLEV